MRSKKKSSRRRTHPRSTQTARRHSAALTFTIGSATHVGIARSDNQDSFGVFQPEPFRTMRTHGRLFIVADGMGGHRGGATASDLAVRTVSERYYASKASEPVDRLAEAFRDANRAIYEQGSSDPLYEGMGTTCSALVIRGDRVSIGHIGDSRIYGITETQIAQTTDDHSRVGDLVRKGIITKEQAKVHPERSLLYRALGARTSAEVDILDLDRPRGTCWYLLCSDGLCNHVSDEEIHRSVLSHPPQAAADDLVHLANSRGGTDNITILVVQIQQVRRAPRRS